MFTGAGTSSNPCSNLYHGPRAFSEPEIKSISDFLYKKRRNMLLYTSMHSYSQVYSPGTRGVMGGIAQH